MENIINNIENEINENLITEEKFFLHLEYDKRKKFINFTKNDIINIKNFNYENDEIEFDILINGTIEKIINNYNIYIVKLPIFKYLNKTYSIKTQLMNNWFSEINSQLYFFHSFEINENKKICIRGCFIDNY